MRWLLTTTLTTVVMLTGLESARADEIVMATWGGDYGKAFQQNMVEPFEKATGHHVRMIFGNSASNEQQLIAQKNNPQIDVITLVQGDSRDAIRQGLLETLDANTFPAIGRFPKIGLPIVDGKVAGIGLWIYGMGIVYRTDKVNWNISSWQDLWDPRLKRKVALPSPKYGDAKFLATMNHFVAAADPKNMAPVFDKLKTLAPNLSFEFDTGVTLGQPWAQGDAYVAAAWSTSAGVLARTGLPAAFVIPKEGAVADIDVIALVKGAPHRQAAIDFIKFATQSEPLGKACAQLNETCIDPDVKEDPKAIMKKEDFAKLFNADDDFLVSKRSELLETWQRDISPLFQH